MAWGEKCLKCEGKNHFRAVCKQKVNSNVGTNSIRVEDSSSSQLYAMFSEVSLELVKIHE